MRSGVPQERYCFGGERSTASGYKVVIVNASGVGGNIEAVT